MDKGKITVGIVGCGEIAHEHLKVWHKLKDVTIQALCDSNESRAMQLASKWAVPHYYSDMEEMLKTGTVSTVDICTPPQAHCPLILQALNAGCNVIVEKPLAMSFAEAKKIAEQYGRSRTKLTVIHNWLHVPSMVKALSLMRSGIIGDIIGLDLRVLAPPQDPMTQDKNHWCHSIPGGRFGEMLAHPIYIIQGILDNVKLTSVQAMKRGIYPWLRFDELRVLFQADGATASLYASFNAHRYDILVDIYGTRGNLRIDQLSDTLIRTRNRPLTIFSKGMDSMQQASQLALVTVERGVAKLTGRWIGGPERCIRSFVASVLTGSEPLVTIRQACDTIELLEKVCQEIDRYK